MTTFRQFSTTGTVARARRQRSHASPSTGDAKVDAALSELSDRLSVVESQVRDNVTAVEISQAVTATTTYTLTHNLNSPVRWYVVDWVGSSNAPSFDRSSSSTLNALVIRANTTGTATIRIESSYGDMT